MTWYAVLGLAVLVLAVGSVVIVSALVRRSVDGVRRIREAHPGEVVLATGLVDAGDLTPLERGRVVAVIADAGGLSFRDGADAEVLSVPVGDILSLELAPLNPRSRMRPLRLERLGGSPIAFWAGSTEDQLLESVIALRTALGRSPG
jgi:hypothetical protein